MYCTASPIQGADCLSKWVGEAERQLRLLFEEARRCQPSIIFFDEIDGLAPVRSAKQDQVHASVVSTLLALMDGLDARGQVVVIGATNRIDAIDPALRRPGRFDREFHFPLPSTEARRYRDKGGHRQGGGEPVLTLPAMYCFTALVMCVQPHPGYPHGQVESPVAGDLEGPPVGADQGAVSDRVYQSFCLCES